MLIIQMKHLKFCVMWYMLRYLLQVTSWILRFINNAKDKKKNISKTGLITAEEIDNAKRLWIKFSQINLIDENKFKQLRKDLRLFVSDGIYQCRGRIELADLEYDTKFSIFIFNNCYFAKLLILHFHKLVKHNGVKETINALRSQYWIPCCRQLAKSVIRECTTCRRIEGRPYSYPPAPPLPESRLNSNFAFKCIALDYAGPLYIKDIYGDCTLNKAWIFLFTCCSSRSILLDLVADCSSRSCVMGIRRFIGRRGVPEIIYSDNGSQFVSTETQYFAANHSIKWKFNAPSAPWWGGMFERLLRMTKRCLKKALKNSKSSYEEVRTLLSEIEMVLNNRPFTYLYNNQGDEALTPNQLVFGHKLKLESSLSACNDIEQDVHIRNTRVEELLYSNDGVVRVAKVCYKQENGSSCLITRPINKLYPTEYSDNEKIVTVAFINEKNIPLLVNGGREC
ncbi:uncharacterized protein LOC124814938 [Hydra vulgaris]|uniref:uncharacterized protein LOC124814938 n=1 Tax=Hydra vulgaris TaxID=6087 RepID=UPI0032EA185A